MSEDMSDMIQKMSNMLKNNEIPDNIKSIINNLSNQSNQSKQSDSLNQSNQKSQSNISNQTAQSNSDISSSKEPRQDAEENNYGRTEDEKKQDSSQDMPNIDINTMLKMKSIIDSMNSQQNDPRANLLRSLKPYLKPSRKEKVDQYIKIFSMGKVFETLNPLGGEKKNDV